MRKLLLLLAILAAGTAASAQSFSEFILFPARNGSSATFTERPTTQKVEVFTQVPGKLFSGVGDTGSACIVTGMFYWYTDEKPTTQETYFLVLRKPDATGRIDVTAKGLIMRAGPFKTPLGGSQRAGGKLTTSFSVPVQIPCKGSLFMGVELSAAPGWPASDGNSVWSARYNPPATRNVGDNPRAGAPPHAWSITGGNASSHPWLWRIGVLTPMPVLNVGGIDPANTRQRPQGSTNYGAGGMYPDLGGRPRRDGVDLRIEDRTAPTGNVFAFASIGLLPTAFKVNPLGGRLYLNPAVILPLGSATKTAGVAIVPVAKPATLPTSLFGLGTIPFQAISLDPTTNRASFTNAQGNNL